MGESTDGFNERFAVTREQQDAFAAESHRRLAAAQLEGLGERRDALVESFGKAGWEFPAPQASMFAWVPIPEKFRYLGSLEFSKLLIEKAEVAVAPGIGFGEHGDDYVRIAVVENEQRIRQAARNIARFLKGADQTLHNVIQMPKAG